ncbi:hypothetical protein AD006_32005 (plasmid) [Pseudonocardia sp. EC080610-09]|uniref:enoyl-CoA hydratase n=1 Tax=unclassified Pseudonocardia TaxID=2619320 RepID=UPI0007065402|nr:MULTISPECIES: enoyl-CoA hydratase [unclassified Pseudonocardia]ALL79754.1 hypothetical protein AD006_32005 [Pseudonocardia sp. EC080610-09]ALL85189.1 hypothetical protein AD017_28535 [Pseudonocardia sp. EC080619-01]
MRTNTTARTDDESGTESGIEVDTAGGVRTLRLARPDRLNAVTAPTLDALCDAVEAADADPGVRVVVLTGTGRAFCAGADFAPDSTHATGRTGTLEAAQRVVRALRHSGTPVLAGVNGPAVGVGVAFALACDVIVAHESAYFLLAFRNVGLMPDGGLTALLPAAVGRVRALEMSLLGERVAAATALDWGLINRVAGADAFDAEVSRLVARLAEGPPLAFAATKRAVDDALRGLLADAMEREHDASAVLSRSDDHLEGIAAFRERRSPRFRGR